MPNVEVDLETSLPPEKVLEALLDFTDRRPDIWPGLERSQYEVYSVGEREAEIREGTKMPGLTIWAKEHYDWSTPGTVTWTVKESNFSTPGSYVSATVTPKDGAGSRIHLTWERTGSTLIGRAIIGLIKLTNGRPLASGLKKALSRMEQAQGG